LPEAYNYIVDFLETTNDNDIALVLEVNLLWLLGRKDEALIKFANCAANDKKKAKEIFELNPTLQDVKEFVHLTED
jgi:hypothetical protein